MTGEGGVPVKKCLMALMILAALAPSPGHSGLSLQIALIDPQRILWERPVAGNNRFSLIHRNSIYGALVWENFQIDDQGIPWLREIKTESPAVLEYYGLEESQTGWIKRTPQDRFNDHQDYHQRGIQLHLDGRVLICPVMFPMEP